MIVVGLDEEDNEDDGGDDVGMYYYRDCKVKFGGLL